MRLIHDGGPTTLYYQHHPLDVEGWRGDNFAFTFNIADYNVVTSDSVHLPPTVHLFMQATGVYVMNFLPKPAEGVPGTERTPWYHRNVDYDEIAFFHGGSLYGIPMPPGLISHAPQGVHHGAPEKARERARRKFDEYDRVDWSVIAIDTRRRLIAVRRGAGQRFGAALMTTTEAPVSYEYDRIPYLIAYQNTSAVRDVYGGVAELVVLESYLLKPKAKPSDTVLVFMHPIGGGAYLPMINALARAGHHVIYCNSRFRGTDSALLMEKVVEDLGECIKDAKNRLGLRQGRAGRLERRRLAFGVLPTAGAAPDGDGQPVRRRPRPDQAGAHPRRRHHAAGRAHQPPRHDDRVDGRVDPRRVRPVQARSRTGPLQPGQPQPAAVHRGVPRPLPRGADRAKPANHRSGSRRNSPNSRRRAGPTTSSASSCTARWPTRAGWTRPSIRTNAPPAPAIWAILRW